MKGKVWFTKKEFVNVLRLLSQRKELKGKKFKITGIYMTIYPNLYILNLLVNDGDSLREVKYSYNRQKNIVYPSKNV